MILLLIFLGLFFFKFNIGSGINMGFRSSRFSSPFGRGRMNRFGRVNIPTINSRQPRNVP